MYINIENKSEFKLGIDIFPGQIGFVHRTGTDQKGWDKFMTAGITALGSDFFSSFSPNHIFMIIGQIDGKIMCLEASGHSAQVVLRDFDEYVNSVDLIVLRELTDELQAKMHLSSAQVKNYVGLKFDDSCILGLGIYQVLVVLFNLIGFKWLSGKIRKLYVPRFGSGIHCSNFIFQVLEDFTQISKFDKNLAKINPDHISPWDLWLSSAFKPCALSAVMNMAIPQKSYTVITEKEGVDKLLTS